MLIIIHSPEKFSKEVNSKFLFLIWATSDMSRLGNSSNELSSNVEQHVELWQYLHLQVHI
jgi:hypothetical protein